MDAFFVLFAPTRKGPGVPDLDLHLLVDGGLWEFAGAHPLHYAAFNSPGEV